MAFVIQGLYQNESVLLHCLSGKHRSGCFASFVIALLDGITVDDAMTFYFEKRPLPEKNDQKVVKKFALRHGLQGILKDMSRKHMYQEMLRRIGRSESSGGARRIIPPEPKKMPHPNFGRSESSAGSGGQGSGVPKHQGRRKPRGSIAHDIGDPEDDDSPAAPPKKTGRVMLKARPKWESRL